MQLGEQLRTIGVPTFPCWARFDQTEGRWLKGPAVPKGEHWALAARRPYLDPALDWSSGVIGVPIPPGIVVIDIDSYKGATHAAIEAYLGCALPWDRAFIQNTIGGGQHYAFQCNWDVIQGDSLGGVKGFDTRCAGRGFICSGSGYTPSGFGVHAFAHPGALPVLPDACRTRLERHEPPARAPAPPPTIEDQDSEQIIAALRFIDPGCPRAEWVRIGLALRHYYADNEPDGLALFDRWSAGEFWINGTPPNYVPTHITGQWQSFKPEGATTAATLFYRAIQAGWQPPATFNTAAAFGPGAAPAPVFEGLVERVRSAGGDIKQTAAIIDEIRAAACNALQVALLAAELKNALKDAGIKDATVGQLVDKLLAARNMALDHPGSIPAAGTHLDENTPLHPTAWAPMQTKGKDLKPKGTLRNFQIMMDAYGVSIEFDEIRKQLRIGGPSAPRAGVLHEEAALSYLDSLANLNEYPVQSVRSGIMPMANDHVINPVQQWVDSAAWDGRDHVGALWQQVALDEGEDRAFCEVLFRKWLRGAYAIGTGRINRWENVVVWVDPNGGAGKTRFFATFCPAELRADGVILDALNRDSIKMAISRWLCELGELDGTMDRSKQNHIKAFLSLERDEMRLAYGRSYLEYPRRTAFFASVNVVKFLLDPSDNRRFWCMAVASANHLHTVDAQQVWAQSAAEFNRGELAHLTADEDRILRMRNEAFRAGSAVSDGLSGLVMAPGTGTTEEHYNVSEILALAGIGRPNKADLNEAAQWLRRFGYRETKNHGKRGFTIGLQVKGEPPANAGHAGAFKPTVVAGTAA